MLSRRDFLKISAAAPFAACSSLAIASAAPLCSPIFVGMDFGIDDYTACFLAQWTDGVCWEVNEDEVASAKPTRWKPLA
jgi:anaerobic selenocysteine-containing dehydrogenase